MRGAGVTLGFVVALSSSALAAEEQREPAFKYGFRDDPMELVARSGSLQAALVRRHVPRLP